MTKCLQDQAYAIFSKSRKFKDIKYDTYSDHQNDQIHQDHKIHQSNQTHLIHQIHQIHLIRQIHQNQHKHWMCCVEGI